MTKVILSWTDERGGCKNAPPEVDKASKKRKTDRRAESDSMHPKGAPSMALGVLNNLSAIYAENNLNNTSASLQKVLQQLSSGSRINSGADDAAGLSLVSGLEANQTALTQSSTNATEGVGLLQVADGALNQVTSLLDRAITLATEASNGTLNTAQDSAANQEYSSILSETNNIGSTTTYNQEQVFAGNTVAIYTGDSSPQGSSVDDLYIRTLSSSNVGDTGGAMSYSDGQNNVFINLSSGETNASVSDSLNASGTTTITVNYMAKGANGTSTLATANIVVGTGTTYANTAQGLINAINNSGLGLSATFTTAAQAGSVAASAALAGNASGGTGAETGIEISGLGLGTGTNGAGEIGTLTVANDSDTLGGSLTIVGPDGKSHLITLGAANSTDTLANLAATINSDDIGVQASYDEANRNIVFTSANATASVTGANVTDQTAPAATDTISSTNSATDYASAGNIGTLVIGNSSDKLTGGLLTITGDNGGIVGGGTGITLGVAGVSDTLTDLLATINNDFAATGGTGVTASLSANGETLTFQANGTGVTGTSTSVVTSNLTAVTPAVSSSIALTGTPTASNTDYSGVVGTLTLAGTSTDTLSGTLNIGTNTIVLGNAVGTNTTDTMAHLLATINKGNYGVTASLNSTVTANGNAIGTVMSFTSSNTAINVSGTSLGDATTLSAVANTTLTGANANVVAQTLKVGNQNDILSGTLSGLDKNGHAYSIALGVSGSTDTLANLAATMNADTTLGITAAISTVTNANDTLTFTPTAGNPQVPKIMQTGLGQNASTLTETVNAPNPKQLGTLTVGGAASAATDTLAGTLSIGNNTIIISAGNGNNTMATLKAYINNLNVGINATLDSTGKIMTFTSTQDAATGYKVSGAGLADLTNDANGTVAAITNTPSEDASAYYSTGISGVITDSSTSGGTNNTGMVVDSNGAGGTATTSYTDAAGANLSNTDLLSQTDAQIALGDLNQAITDVAAMDGYIGAQINTLNSVSQVMSTQEENVVSAQNAIQATDYASATANMSKYEILSQTGIAALAQANSVQQEVTKLLQ
jgi:flagellin